MSGQRQKNQPEQGVLAFPRESRSEAPTAVGKGTETPMAKRKTENPADTEQLMEEVCNWENCMQAWDRVKANKGSPGVDGMTIAEFPAYLQQHGPELWKQLRSGTYQPQPVKRVEIPKPDGGVRKLGIPTVLDRFVQQAVLQVLQKRWDPTFSDHSYGFRPGRSAGQAVGQAQQYIAEGYRWVVDLDLEKFFDRVNHDRLMAAVAERVSDKRMRQLIGAFLKAGVMEKGLVSAVDEGTPQGGPLSPLLSNLVLDELDRELQQRGHRYARYADDCNIYVRSQHAGQRVMESVSRFIAQRLKLKVNEQKSAVARAWERKFLGFSFTSERKTRRRIAPKAIVRFRERIRELTRRNRGISLPKMVKDVSAYLRGWLAYFGLCQTPTVLQDLEAWLRRRLRSVVWKQWKRGRTRFAELCKRGVSRELAGKTAARSDGPWRMAISTALNIALPNDYFLSLGLPPMVVRS
jgi:RNA-directed DNA polymerase